jgi:hypothetical protein
MKTSTCKEGAKGCTVEGKRREEGNGNGNDNDNEVPSLLMWRAFAVRDVCFVCRAAVVAQGNEQKVVVTILATFIPALRL